MYVRDMCTLEHMGQVGERGLVICAYVCSCLPLWGGDALVLVPLSCACSRWVL